MNATHENTAAATVAAASGLYAKMRDALSRVELMVCALLLLMSFLPIRAARAQDSQAQDNAATTNTTTVNQNSSTANQTVKAQSVLRGHVSYENTGRPVRRARLMLLPRDGHSPQNSGMTNSRGDFQIRNVPEGRYYIMVDAAGLVTPISLLDLDKLDNSKIDFDLVGSQFEEVYVDGINDKEIEVHARRGGAISGRITYPDGDPAINVHVNILRRRGEELKPFLTSISPSAFFGIQTDDRGVYRFSGLPPGEYVVGASENIEHGTARSGHEDDFMASALFGLNSLVMTFYQNASRARDATAIKIEAGAEEKNVDITLAERGLYTISGIVKSRRDNSPLARARLTLTSKDRSPNSTLIPVASELQPNSETDELGQWSFNEIPDGDYVITITPPYSTEATQASDDADAPSGVLVARNARRLSEKRQNLKVNGHDVTDLVLELSDGARISGTVTLEGGKAVPSSSSPSLIIGLNPTDEETDLTGSNAMVGQNGKFVIDGLSGGKFYFSLSGPESKYYLKSVYANGTDLLREPLVVQESVDVKDVRITVASDMGTLTGHLLASAGGAPLSNARFMLYPADPGLWMRSGRIISGNTDEAGAFTASAPPGEYLLVIVRDAEQPMLYNVGYIKSRLATATHVQILPNVQKSVELTAGKQP